MTESLKVGSRYVLLVEAIHDHCLQMTGVEVF
jgi:hypothetical protein